MVWPLGTRAQRVAVVLAFAAAGTGCSNLHDSGESGNAVPLPEDMPHCSDQYQPGKIIEEGTFGQACRTDSDELAVPRFVRLACADDTTLVWNDWAWGYVGQQMQLFGANAQERMPTEQALECRANANADLQSLVQERLEQIEQAENEAEQAESIASERILVGASRIND